MKAHLKTILVFIITAVYILPNFYLVGNNGDSSFLPKNLSEKKPMFILSESNLSDFSINSSAGNKVLNVKILKIRINSAEPGKKCYIFKQIKTYQLDNDTHFNFPLISYKFSLREYTEGSWTSPPLFQTRHSF